MTTTSEADLALLTTEGVHNLTGIAVGTLRAWRHRQVGPPSFRLGGVVVYRKTAVLDWIRAGEEAENERRSTTRQKS